MRCVAFCTAANYRLQALVDYFRAKQFKIKHYREVLHITKPNAEWDIFFFANGCFVAWGLRRIEELRYLEEVKYFSQDQLENIEISQYIYRIGKETKITLHERFNADVITIGAEEAENSQLKLAISYGLAQSVKLESYEDSIQKTIANNSHIPIELAKFGRISLSRHAISKRIGETFLERIYINLRGEYFDLPEYFWQYPSFESYYLMTERFLDIPKRVAALNRKIDVLHGIFEVLNDQLQHRYSSMLELIIILLVLSEVILSIFHFHM